MLLYSAIGQWTYASRITYSFMPDGTSIGGTPSALFQTMNAVAPTATWQTQIEQGATPWQANANLNLALVPDSGDPMGTNGNQQDDPRFGDIRIGAMPLPSGVLAETFLPPPTNGGTAAGDIIFNSTVQWQIGTGFDLQTIAAHEFGHALGLGDQSTDIYGEMYYAYDGIKTTLDSDDVAGIQSLYGAIPMNKNFSVLYATNITPNIDGNGQITLPGLENPAATTSEWYAVTVPATNSGQMVVTAQSSNLSSFAPALYVYNSSLSQKALVSAPTTYGATLTATVPVSAGQKYYIKVMYGGSYGRVGAYGLEVNFGSQSMPPIAPPNTVVAQQPDLGSGSTSNAITTTHGGGTPGIPGAKWTVMGDLAGWATSFTTQAAVAGPGPISGGPSPVAPPTSPSSPIVGPIAIVPINVPAPIAAPPPGGSSGSLLPASITTTHTAHHHHRRVHQALDVALSGWAGHRKRPQVARSARSSDQWSVVSGQ